MRVRFVGLRQLLLQRLIDLLQLDGERLVGRRHLVLGHDTFANQPRAEHRTRRGVLADHLVHQRLRERGLVRFVVTVSPIANEVDEEILVESLPVGDAEPHGVHARFGVVAVDVNDRHLESLRQIARVVRRARVDRIGR